MKKSCEICQKLKDKKKIVYEDDVIVAVLPEKPAIKGHIRIFSKKHFTHLEELKDEEMEHFFAAASYAATTLFELTQAQGTNIICNNGEFIGALPHLNIDVMARKFDDGLNFQWEPKQLTPNEMEEMKSRINSKVGIKKEEPVVIEEKEEKKKIKHKEKEENYLIKQLHRMP